MCGCRDVESERSELLVELGEVLRCCCSVVYLVVGTTTRFNLLAMILGLEAD